MIRDADDKDREEDREEDKEEDKEIMIKYNRYVKNVDRLKTMLSKYIRDQHHLDRLGNIIFFVLNLVGNDLISAHYFSPVPSQSYKKLPRGLFSKRIPVIDKQLFSEIVTSFVEYNNEVAVKNEYTYNPYDLSNFSSQDEYINVIENILDLKNTI